MTRRRMRRDATDLFWDPFGVLEQMRETLDRALGEGGVAASVALVPPLDLSETDNELVVRLEVPGVDPNSLNVEATEDTLTVSGEVKNEAEEKGEHFYRIERQYGSFERSVSLPVPIDPESVDATYKDGVLTIRMKKQEAQQRKKVNVKLE